MPTCPDCHGTGRDDTKTRYAASRDAEFAHRVKHHGSYVRCWTCNGNGIVVREGRSPTGRLARSEPNIQNIKPPLTPEQAETVRVVKDAVRKTR